MDTTKTIYLNYTTEEWEILTRIANDRNGRSVRTWLNAEIRDLANKVHKNNVCLTCEDNSPIKKPQNFQLLPHVVAEIECLSTRFGIGRATLIQRFIIDKHLTQHYENEWPQS